VRAADDDDSISLLTLLYVEQEVSARSTISGNLQWLQFVLC